MNNVAYFILTARVELKHEDPRWIGAWWFGFALGGVLMFFFTLLLFCFPKTREVAKDDEETSDIEELNTLTDEEVVALKVEAGRSFSI